MKYNPSFHHRRSIRLKGYDYSQPGLYFITICAKNRAHLFGEIVDGVMVLNAAGEIAKKYLLEIQEHFPHTKLHQFVVMPNHIHFIIEIVVGATVGANNYSPQQSPQQSPPQSPRQPPRQPPLQSPLQSSKPHGTSKTVGSIVRGFKIGVTKWFRKNTDIYTVWQRNYYEHIIRNEESYHRIAEYIQNNPLKWREDRYYD